MALQQDRFHVVVDGVRAGPYARFPVGISTPVFSRDSRHWAAVVEDNYVNFLVLDGKEGPRYDSTKDVLVVDAVEDKRYEGFSQPIFSPDSRRLAYAARRGEKWRAVIGGVEGPGYGSFALGSLFSPDSRHVAFLAQRDDKKYVIVVDGGESQAYDDYAGEGELVFDGPDLLRAVMIRNGEGLRVEIGIR